MFTLTVSLTFPVILPQLMVFTAKVHVFPSVGTSVQVIVVWFVVVGQLPQFDALISYSIEEQVFVTGLHIKFTSFELKSARFTYSLSGGES